MVCRSRPLPRTGDALMHGCRATATHGGIDWRNPWVAPSSLVSGELRAGHRVPQRRAVIGHHAGLVRTGYSGVTHVTGGA
jgi:hypothetical protein